MSRAAPPEQRDELRVAGLLDGDRRAGLDEQLDRQVQCLLSACRDEHFVGPRVDAAPRQHLAPDFLDQHRVVGVRGVRGPVADLRQM